MGTRYLGMFTGGVGNPPVYWRVVMRTRMFAAASNLQSFRVPMFVSQLFQMNPIFCRYLPPRLLLYFMMSRSFKLSVLHSKAYSSTCGEQEADFCGSVQECVTHMY